MTDRGAVTRRGFLRGAAGTAAVAGAAGTASAQEEDEGGQTFEIELVDFAFEPGTDSPAEIPPGTEVTFVWQTSTHNIVVDSKPDESDWEGHENIENEGFEHSHTFEVEGTYEFHCQPHQAQGMVGTIEVAEGATIGDGSGDGAPVPSIPDAAKAIGLGLFLAMLTTLGLAYFLLRYGGNPGEQSE